MDTMSLPLKFTAFREKASLDEQIAFLDTLFEPTDSLIYFTLKNKLFQKSLATQVNSYDSLIELIRKTLLDLNQAAEAEGISSFKIDHLANIIGAHPRLGEPPKQLSVHSLNEQKNLGGGSSGSGEASTVKEELMHLNSQYEAVYPGLRFISFVNGRSRPQIMAEMRARISSGHTWFEEVAIGINAMCDIALDRLHKYANYKQKL
ncbi:hypothetical protein ACO0QE_004348 [Hanseniaspora vineae]